MRYLHFEIVRGDLQEDHVYDKRLCGYGSDANFLSSWCQSPSSRAQNRGFCAFLPFGTLVFGHFEHKIGVFVSEWAVFPWFSGFPSTKWFFVKFRAVKLSKFGRF